MVRLAEAQKREAMKSYVFKTYLRDDAIKIKSRDGAVTLTGTVAEESHKSLAVETAANIPEVKSVDDQLEVEGEQPDEASETWLSTKAQIKMSLLYHRSTSGLQTKVETRDGVVTLSGKAGSEAEKDLATQYAKDVSGVKEVQNLMSIE